MKTLDIFIKFFDTLSNVEDEWANLYSEIGKADQEISDLLHEIELTDFSAEEGYRLSNELKKVRTRRRDMKNEQEKLKHLKEFAEKNKGLKSSIYRTIATIKKTEEYQKDRVYSPRIRTDLKLNENIAENSFLEGKVIQEISCKEFIDEKGKIAANE